MSRFDFKCYDKVNKRWINETPCNLFGETVLFGAWANVPLRDLNNVVALQSTGLKDKKGREIFEGDFVEGRLFCDGYTLPTAGIVEYSKKFAAFSLTNLSGQTLFYNHDVRSFEIKGNIFDNSELCHGIELEQ